MYVLAGGGFDESRCLVSSPFPHPKFFASSTQCLFLRACSEKKYLTRAVNIFENVLSFGNHLGMFSEEIARSGEQLGNTPQAFSHLALISAAFNLDRATTTGH